MDFLLCQVAKYKKFFLVRRAIAPISQQVRVIGVKKFNFSLTYDPVFLPQAYHRFVEAINRIRILKTEYDDKPLSAAQRFFFFGKYSRSH